MKPIPFLTEKEIQKLQEAEAHLSKEQKKTAEQIEAIYTSGQNILVFSIGWFRGRLLSWQSAF